ncbi:MAG: hypothetical protein K6F99_04565, partial [Lachnospiraceae bacterium]|nr:hypothetical protein [Lachnospiraceae bacterium]
MNNVIKTDKNKLRRLLIIGVVATVILLIFCYLKIQSEDELYYGVYEFEDMFENADTSLGVVSITEDMGLKEGDVICNTPFIHIQGGKYDFIADHQGDVDSVMYIKDRDRIVGEYTLPADELITTVHLEPGFDIYSMKVIFTYPGSGNVTIKNLKIHSEGPFYTDTIFLYICLIISVFALGLWAYKTGFLEKNNENEKEKILMLLVFGLLMFVSYPLFWDRFVARTDMGYHLARIENTRNELLAGHFPMSIY